MPPQLVTRQNTNKTQTKILNANRTVNGLATDLTFNNLGIGKWYEISGQVLFGLDQLAVNDDAVTLAINNGGTLVLQLGGNIGAPDTQNDLIYVGVSTKFQATATSLTFTVTDASVNSFVVGNGLKEATFIHLEERNDLIATAIF